MENILGITEHKPESTKYFSKENMKRGISGKISLKWFLPSMRTYFLSANLLLKIRRFLLG
jgi:hypothetical protein